ARDDGEARTAGHRDASPAASGRDRPRRRRGSAGGLLPAGAQRPLHPDGAAGHGPELTDEKGLPRFAPTASDTRVSFCDARLRTVRCARCASRRFLRLERRERKRLARYGAPLAYGRRQPFLIGQLLSTASGTLKATVMDADAINRSLKRIAHEIVERNRGVEDLVVVGVMSKGAPLARRLAALLGSLERREVPVGAIDPSPHRDDLHLGAAPAKDGLAEVPDIAGKTVVLVDDVIWHGRTVRCAVGEGEVVFNTAMTGYQEVLTDPSYAGQMICMTYPLQGNYGVNDADPESEQPWVRAFIVRWECDRPSNFRAVDSLDGYLKRHRIPGIHGIDTRALTRHLRSKGALRAVLSHESVEPDAARLAVLAEAARRVTPLAEQDL